MIEKIGFSTLIFLDLSSMDPRQEAPHKTHSRVTMRDISKKTGFHLSTISLAFQNSSQLPLATIEKIKKTADEMGYRPDPFLKSLNNYRSKKNSVSFKGVIAWMNCFRRPKNCQDWYGEYLAGAKKSAEEKGFSIQEFWYHDPKENRKRWGEILENRGIQGILWSPQENNFSRLKFNWDKFSSVTFGDSLYSPKLHMVSNHQYHTTYLMMRKLRSKGYRRIGYILEKSVNDRLMSQFYGAYLEEREKISKNDQINPLIIPIFKPNLFWNWMKKEKPEVIITNRIDIVDLLKDKNIRIPEDLGVALFSVDSKTKGEFAGVDQQMLATGSVAMDYLASMIYRNERGLPKIPVNILVRGIWSEGRSLATRF